MCQFSFALFLFWQVFEMRMLRNIHLLFAAPQRVFGEVEAQRPALRTVKPSILL